MKRSVPGLVPLLCVLLPALAAADTTIYPLDIASPDFPDPSASTEFTVDLPIAAASRIVVHAWGVYQEVIYVDISSPYATGTSPARLDFRIGDDGTSEWLHRARITFPAGTGEFDLEVVLLERGTADWGFLTDGKGHIEIVCGPSTIQLYSGRILSAMSSWGSLSGVELVVSHDGSVPAVVDTWGAVKALFR